MAAVTSSCFGEGTALTRIAEVACAKE